MKITEQVIQTEAAITALLTGARGWIVWHDERDKRGHQPNFIALHIPSKMVVAVFARPRRLAPSERPDASWLPGDWLPVVWYAALAPQIRVWLVAPQGSDPPGLYRENPTQ